MTASRSASETRTAAASPCSLAVTGKGFHPAAPPSTDVLAAEHAQPHRAYVVVHVEVDETDALPGPERQPAVDDGDGCVRRNHGRHDVRTAVTAGAVRVPPPVVRGQQVG